MSNRFAWACKLTELGMPVILVYLGFLSATEMQDLGEPLPSAVEWEALVRAHGKDLVPEPVWNQTIQVNGQQLVPLIRSTEIQLPG
jgi:hypothetical protein